MTLVPDYCKHHYVALPWIEEAQPQEEAKTEKIDWKTYRHPDWKSEAFRHEKILANLVLNYRQDENGRWVPKNK